MPPQVNLSTNQPKDKTMDTNEPTNPTIGAAITAPHTREPKELRIKLPKPFTGNHANLQCFIQDCAVYLKINESIYGHNDKWIAFMLLLLESDKPAIWKEQYLTSVMTDTSLNFSLFGDFLTNFRKAFEDVNQVNEAMNDLGRIQQGNKRAEEHTTIFWLLVGKARISSVKNPNHQVLIDLYQKSLKLKLAKRIMSIEHIPNTIKE